MSNNFNNTSDNNVDDEEDIILKRLNSKISVMIAEAEAALNSKVEVTELEMILAEEKERDERIMKEFGIQTLNSDNKTLLSKTLKPSKNIVMEKFIASFEVFNGNIQDKIAEDIQNCANWSASIIRKNFNEFLKKFPLPSESLVTTQTDTINNEE
ncbi:hypothetical protein RhiirB3_442134 [Rhizophagus irregularis]|nr:hypothetical protein RhiirB3_442134 [Rhizophagus irregularis]